MDSFSKSDLLRSGLLSKVIHFLKRTILDVIYVEATNFRSDKFRSYLFFEIFLSQFAKVDIWERSSSSE